jgi:murein DD-endopeptidase MepM/ murein hydrolase activator NlpD
MKDEPRSPGGEEGLPAQTRPAYPFSTQLPAVNPGSAEQQHVSRQPARTGRNHKLVAGGILALALLFAAASLCLIIGEKLIGPPVTRIPLYTPRPIAVRPTHTAPPATPRAQPTTAVPALDPTAALVPPQTPMPVQTETKVTAENAAQDRPGSLAFAVPVIGSVSTGFSPIHPALDFDAPVGTTVVATAGGRVVFAGWSQRGHGNLVVVNHDLGWQSWYAHLESLSVGTGEWVCRNCAIGTVGNTGFSSDPHLHFEIRHGCTFYNLFSGETLSDGVGANYRYDPFGTPICLTTATPPPPSDGPITPDTEPSGNASTPTAHTRMDDPDAADP